MNTSNKSSPAIERISVSHDQTPHQPVIDLPDKPVVIIEAQRNSLNLTELWQYRDLLYVLTLRDVKVRYKQTVLGILWAIIQPLFMMIIFTVFFSRLAGIQSDGVPYAVFAYAGLVPWTFFSNSVNNSGNSLVGNSSLITKVYFPRMIIPLAAVGAGLIDLIIAFVLLVLLMIYYGHRFFTKSSDAAASYFTDSIISGRLWDVDVGNQRKISRCPLRFTFFNSNLDVCHSDYLSFQSCPG